MVRRSAPLPEQPNDCRTHRSGPIDRLAVDRLAVPIDRLAVPIERLADRSIGGADRSIGGTNRLFLKRMAHHRFHGVARYSRNHGL